MALTSRMDCVSAPSTPNWQPHLIGTSIKLRPLTEGDFEELFEAASDPLIWEQHPDRERYTRKRFEEYFCSAMDSRGAFTILDLQTGKMIGSSRFTSYSPENKSIEIGYTFLVRSHWGGTFNRELKTLMLNYAFQFVDCVYFVVGKENMRSRRAMVKFGGTLVESAGIALPGDLSASVVYRIAKVH